MVGNVSIAMEYCSEHVMNRNDFLDKLRFTRDMSYN